MSEPGVVVSPDARDPSKIPQVAITDYFFEKLKNNLPHLKDKDFVVDVSGGKSIKFSDVENMSRKIASALSKRGFQKGDILYFVTYEFALLYIVQVAVWRLGGAVRGNFQTDESEEYARQLKQTRSRFVLVDADTIELLRKSTSELDWSMDFICIGDVPVEGTTSVNELLQDDGSAFPEKLEVNVHDDVVFIPNTSGSTGKPKGVLHTHFTAVTMVETKVIFATLGGSIMAPMSNFQVGSYIMTLTSLTQGVTIYHLGRFHKPDYINLLVKYKPSIPIMYPFLASWFARNSALDTLDLSFIKNIIIGGSVLDQTTAKLLETRLSGAKISLHYNMSESIPVATTEVIEGVHQFCVTENDGETCVSSGKIVPYAQVKVVDITSGTTLDPGQRGQILIRSPSTMKGYLTVVGQEPNRSDIDKDGWFHSGDIGFLDNDGNIYVKERMSFVFKYYMYFVSPAAIESVIQEHPSVQAAGVVGIPNAETTSLARAFVVLRAGCNASELQIEQYVASRMPQHMHLHGGVRFVPSLPESRGGKLDRLALKKFAIQ